MCMQDLRIERQYAGNPVDGTNTDFILAPNPHRVGWTLAAGDFVAQVRAFFGTSVNGIPMGAINVAGGLSVIHHDYRTIGQLIQGQFFFNANGASRYSVTEIIASAELLAAIQRERL